VCVNTVTSRTLNHLATRAVQRHRLLRENRRLTQAERQRLDREHAEARHLLDELGSIAADLERLRMSAAGTGRSHAMPEGPLPPELFAHYRELLRAHVIMGSGNLSSEMATLAELLADGGITAPQTMQLHVQVLEDLVRGLGSRSARHVMTRADLLVLEVLVHLAERYRLRCQESVAQGAPGQPC
jgi:hypothetical protein